MGLVSVFRIAGLMGSIRAPVTGGGVGLDVPEASTGSLLWENLLEKVRDRTSEVWFWGGNMKGSGFGFSFSFCALRLLRLLK